MKNSMLRFRVALAGLVAALCAGFHRITSPGAIALENASQPTYVGHINTKIADTAIGRRIVVKAGSDSDHIAVAGVADIPEGITQEDAASAAGASVGYRVFGLGDRAVEGTASGDIANGAFVVPAAAGAVRTLPATSGTYYIIGKAIYGATSGNTVVFVPCVPVQRVV